MTTTHFEKSKKFITAIYLLMFLLVGTIFLGTVIYFQAKWSDPGLSELRSKPIIKIEVDEFIPRSTFFCNKYIITDEHHITLLVNQLAALPPIDEQRLAFQYDIQLTIYFKDGHQESFAAGSQQFWVHDDGSLFRISDAALNNFLMICKKSGTGRRIERE